MTVREWVTRRRGRGNQVVPASTAETGLRDLAIGERATRRVPGQRAHDKLPVAFSSRLTLEATCCITEWVGRCPLHHVLELELELQRVLLVSPWRMADQILLNKFNSV